MTERVLVYMTGPFFYSCYLIYGKGNGRGNGMGKTILDLGNLNFSDDSILREINKLYSRVPIETEEKHKRDGLIRELILHDYTFIHVSSNLFADTREPSHETTTKIVTPVLKTSRSRLEAIERKTLLFSIPYASLSFSATGRSDFSSSIHRPPMDAKASYQGQCNQENTIATEPGRKGKLPEPDNLENHQPNPLQINLKYNTFKWMYNRCTCMKYPFAGNGKKAPRQGSVGIYPFQKYCGWVATGRYPQYNHWTVTAINAMARYLKKMRTTYFRIKRFEVERDDVVKIVDSERIGGLLDRGVTFMKYISRFDGQHRVVLVGNNHKQDNAYALKQFNLVQGMDSWNVLEGWIKCADNLHNHIWKTLDGGKVWEWAGEGRKFDIRDCRVDDGGNGYCPACGKMLKGYDPWAVLDDAWFDWRKERYVAGTAGFTPRHVRKERKMNQETTVKAKMGRPRGSLRGGLRGTRQRPGTTPASLTGDLTLPF